MTVSQEMRRPNGAYTELNDFGSITPAVASAKRLIGARVAGGGSCFCAGILGGSLVVGGGGGGSGFGGGRRQPCHQHGEIVLERKLVPSAVGRASDGEIDGARSIRGKHPGRVADGLVIEPVADTRAETLGQVANLLVRLVAQRDVEHERVLRVETEHFLKANL